MFLTRKKWNFIRFVAGVYYFLAFICLMAAVVFSAFGVSVKDFVILFVFSLFMALIVPIWGKRSAGKWKLASKGYKLVFHELRPAEFAALYDKTSNDPNNVIAKPDLQILGYLLAAYDSMGETERCFAVLDEMEALAINDVLKKRVKLFRASILFSAEKTEEGLALCDELTAEKLDPVTEKILQSLIRGDKAMATGDHDTAEAYFLESLVRKSPKPTPLSLLIDHFYLAVIYLARGEADKAKEHLICCAKSGGETDIKAKAVKMLENI